jgi:hypothetical protein
MPTSAKQIFTTIEQTKQHPSTLEKPFTTTSHEETQAFPSTPQWGSSFNA